MDAFSRRTGSGDEVRARTGRRAPRRPDPARALAGILLAAILLAPGIAPAERVVTRSGEVFLGEVRFEDDDVVIVRPDGSELRIPRREIERIELTPEQEPAPEPPEEPDVAEPAPTFPGPPRFVPPAPPPVRRPAYLESGPVVAAGYHRGFSLGAEWQQRLSRSFALGLGAQVGVEPAAPDLAFGTWGATARAYLGVESRLAFELGVGLNLIKPCVDPGRSCDESERSIGPEISAGYQHVSPSGFLFEALGGIVVATNEAIREDRSISPSFQLSAGYLFH